MTRQSYYSGYAGGERGIRYLDALLESVRYRFYVAPPAIFAICPVAPCTLLHAGAVKPAGRLRHLAGYRAFRQNVLQSGYNMPNRKRWHTEVAGVFLLWVEEVEPDNPSDPPWRGNTLRRLWRTFIETPDGTPQEVMEPWGGTFVARSKRIAMDSAVETVRNSFRGFDDWLKSLVWIESQASDEKWAMACDRFIHGKDFELS